MATRSRSGLLLPIFVAVGIVAVVGIGPIKSAVDDMLGGVTGYDTVVLGEGEATLMVTESAAPNLEDCTVDSILATKQCGEIKLVILDAAKMPFIGRNISSAWGEGKDFQLHRDTPQSRRAKWSASCGSFTRSYPLGSCDEYPFASSQEGGAGARTEEVPDREQSCQGGTISRAYALQKISVGDEYLVGIAHPDRIAAEPYAGVDIAKDASCAS
ncbi:NucA/NucB deoxyribonuclease domain-containing protein [Actinophytocola sp.]|uniref:NucA/NucB deoxyribonuclease domain-containing protein n=1 Tax=Actinophytocola sp. TaxID=1872138 RepID=UPI003D6A3390